MKDLEASLRTLHRRGQARGKPAMTKSQCFVADAKWHEGTLKKRSVSSILKWPKMNTIF